MDIRHRSFAWKATVCSIIATLMVLSAGLAVWRQAATDYKSRPTFFDVTIGDIIIPVEIADTQETLEKGLSGRFHLPKKQGMLFIFPTPDTYAFWMPNMNFPIDLIWINEEGLVVGFEQSMQPEKDLKHPHYYKAPVPIQYVVEVNAGFVKKYGIAVGQEVILPDTSTGHRAFF